MTPTCNSNALELLPHLPQPQMTMTPNVVHPVNSISRHMNSPSKSKPPTRVTSPIKQRRLSSPRKSPKKVLFQNSEPISFTPQRTKQPPRAWERRPATPFAPRDEKQKIWKRVPLGELGIDTNRPSGISRREQERSKDYIRVVKKLKTGHVGVDIDDKENYAIDTKLVNQEDALKRPYLRGGDFVSMRMEEDEILGSPRKKLRQVSQDHHFEDAKTASFGSDGSSDDHEVDEQDAGMDPHMNMSVALSNSALEDDDEDLEVQHITSEPSVNKLKASVGHVEETTRATPSQEIEAVCATDIAIENIAATITTYLEDVDTSAGMNENVDTSVSVQGIDEDSAKYEDDNGIEEPQSSSPPTILAENVLVDELELAESQNKEESTELEHESNMKTTTTQEPRDRHVNRVAPKRVSDDETAFLQSFLSRTKAQKAARECEAKPLPLATEIMPPHVDESIEKQEIVQLEEIALPTPSDPLAENSEELPASPLRRSRRAVVTGLSRTPSLPSAIQLKRANGNEFIFSANKATSSANVAILTRTNTKQNKGSALNVRARLDQLVTGKDTSEVSESSEFALEAIDPDKTSTKRKRSKTDDGRKARKVLRWNDDNLVSYQEFQSDDTLEAGTEDNISDTSPKDDANTNVGSIAKIKLTMTLPSSNTSKGKNRDATQELDSSQSRVRRVRRGIVGSVNGTPGPKTRSRKIIDESDVTDTIHTEVNADELLPESAAATVALNTLADQTSKTTTTTAPVTRRSRIAVPATRNVKVTSSWSSESTKTEGNSDPLGKRRLRVRD